MTKPYIIQKQFVVDAESEQQAQDIAGMIGYVVLESNHFDVYVSDTISVKEAQ
jgi:hypothetical protein